jgi:hypothetical protein
METGRVILIVGLIAVFVFAALLRYDYTASDSTFMRADRWTGTVCQTEAPALVWVCGQPEIQKVDE